MVLLDTNVVSDLMRAAPSAEVVVWMDALPPRELFVTAITEAEVRTGIAILPAGARRRGLADAAERTFRGLFAGRVLPFDSDAAHAYADIAAASRAAGRPISQSHFNGLCRSLPWPTARPATSSSGRCRTPSVCVRARRARR